MIFIFKRTFLRPQVVNRRVIREIGEGPASRRVTFGLGENQISLGAQLAPDRRIQTDQKWHICEQDMCQNHRQKTYHRFVGFKWLQKISTAICWSETFPKLACSESEIDLIPNTNAPCKLEYIVTNIGPKITQM